MYRVNKFTLRDLSSSKVKGGTTERWTGKGLKILQGGYVTLLVEIKLPVHHLKAFLGISGMFGTSPMKKSSNTCEISFQKMLGFTIIVNSKLFLFR
jgi:hypothetical protein